MTFDPVKNANRIKLQVSTAKNEGYSGVVLLEIAKLLKGKPSIEEADLASELGVDPGYNNSGVGDLKRLVISLQEILTNSPKK